MAWPPRPSERLAALAALAAAAWGPAAAGALRLGEGVGADSAGPLEPLTPATSETRDGVLYKHMSKTGGRYARHMLHKTLGSSFHQLLEPEGLAPLREAWRGRDRHERPFIIGSMRNPCDYYVSMWAYNSQGPLGGPENYGMSRFAPELHKHLGQDNSTSFGSEEDVQRFRRWLRALPSPRFNYVSIRFWLNYYSMAAQRYEDCRDHKGCLRDQGLLADVAAGLEPEPAPTGVDCWVMTESAPADLRACLERYSRERNVTVDFTYFNKKGERPGKLQHRSDHLPCAHYYDQDSADFVRKMDRSLVDFFGFKTCCTEGGLAWGDTRNATAATAAA